MRSKLSTSRSLANIFAETAIRFAQETEVLVSQRVHGKTRQPIVELRSDDFAEVMKVYAQTVQTLSLDEPFRAETTFFHTFQQHTVRCTAFANVGR